MHLLMIIFQARETAAKSYLDSVADPPCFWVYLPMLMLRPKELNKGLDLKGGN
jgi:hypothetical protein